MMRSTLCTLTITSLALLALASPTPGEAQVSSRTHRVTDSGIDERISLELQEAVVTDVLDSLAQILEVEAEIDPEVHGEITIELHNVRPTTALTAVCESAWCLWRIEEGRLKVVLDPEAPAGFGGAPGRAEGAPAETLNEAIDIDLKDADLRETLAAFGSIAGVKVEIDEAVQGRITVQLHDTPVHEALDAICRIEGCSWELLGPDHDPVLRFSPR